MKPFKKIRLEAKPPQVFKTTLSRSSSWKVGCVHPRSPAEAFSSVPSKYLFPFVVIHYKPCYQEIKGPMQKVTVWQRIRTHTYRCVHSRFSFPPVSWSSINIKSQSLELSVQVTNVSRFQITNMWERCSMKVSWGYLSCFQNVKLLKHFFFKTLFLLNI